MRYEDASGTFQASGPIANDDSDTLTAGSRGPATGNLITGEGTQYGSAGADSAAGAQVTAIAGKGGEDSSFAGGKLSVTGEFGQLSVDAQGNYTYLANTGAPENVRDRFVYTLADDQGNSDTAALIVEIGKTPVAIKADAQQIVPGPDGVVTLPPGVELSDIMVVGRNLVVNLPDGTQLIIVDGAIFVPQLVLGGVEVPATNVAALLIGQEVQPAAGETPPSSGGNFAVPPPPLDPGVPLGDLIPPTEYNYIPPEPQEVFPEADDEDPEILIQPDGQPASVAAVDEVDERGLPTRNGGEPEGTGEGADGNASNDSDTSEATAGTIIINSPDGVDSVTIAGADGVPHEIEVGLVVQGEYGTLTITGIVGDDYTYSYVLDDNIDHSDGAPDQDDFSVVLTDDDGDTASATLTINILDDVPTAVDDTDTIAAGEFGPATGNVLTDADAGDAGDDDDGADTVGADDAELTNVTGFGDTEAVEGGWVVQGQYGVLTIGTDGSYSYVRNEGTPGGVEDVFTYTLTDGDTDTDTATLTITIENATPETGENPTALLDDDALEDGNPGTPAVGDDVDAANLTGFLAGSGGDGPLTFDLLLTGAPDGFSYVDGPDGAVHVMQGTTHVMTVTIDAATGEYEVSQINPIDHSAGGLENNAPFTINYTVTDQDDDSAPGTLTINVDDDTPVVTVELDRQGAVTVDESGPTGASTIEFTGDEGDDGDVDGSGPIGRAVGSTAVVQASALFGADGPAADAELTYALALGSADTDLTLTDGSAIELQLIDGVVVGVVTEGDHEGEAAFAIAINPETGVATVELYLSLDHPDDTNPNDSLPLGEDTVSVVVSATDGDNDTTESDPVDISGLFNFLDDGPSADGEANPAGAVTVDESGPTGASTIEFTGDEGDDGDVAGSGPIGRAVGTAAVVDGSAVFGADGPGGDDLSYALALGGSETALTLTDGSAIELQLIDGVIVGMVTEGSHDGEAAFAIAIDPATGVATVELYLSLDHPDVNDPNDSLPLGPNTVDVIVSATDGDGDSADSDPIDISGLFNFLDDGPAVEGEVDEQGAVTVDESGPTGASTIEFTGDEGDDLDVAGSGPIGRAVGGTAVVNANALFGADGPSGADLSYALALGGSDTALTLTDGSAIELQLVDGVIVGVVTEGAHDGDAAFAIAIDPSTGVATVELYLSLDHPDVTDDNDSLPLGPNTIDVVVTATDGDGDSVDSDPVDISGLFNFLDDGPSVEGRLSTEGPAIVDESPPVAAAAINTDPYVKGDDPDLVGGQAIGSGSTTLLVPTADFGADGPAADDSLTFELTVTNPSSGLTLTDGSEINLVLLESGVVVGVVSGGDFDGQAAFALSLDPGTGVVTVELYLSLDHPDDTDANDVLTLAAGSLGAVVVATDGDGDTATSAVIDVGSRIQFLDDGPDANDDSANQVGEDASVTVNVLTNDVEGADGVVNGDVSYVDGTLTGAGVLVYNGDGTFTYTPAPGEEGTVTFDYQIVDGDDDPSVATVTLNLGEDSTPQVGAPENLEVDEDGFAFANDDAAPLQANPSETDHGENLTDSGNVVVDFGNDVPGAPLADSIELLDSAAYDGQLVDLDGNPVTFALNGSGQLVGSTANGTVMVISVTGAVAGPGAGEVTYTYSAQLLQPVQHADAGNTENNDLLSGIQFQVTDSDGDPATGSFNVTVWDDVPSAEDIEVNQAGEDANVVVSIVSSITEGADGVDLADVTFSDHDGDGSLTYNDATGEFTYDPAAGEEGDVSFTYTIVDGDGDEITKEITIHLGDDATPQVGTPQNLTVDEDGLGGANVDSAPLQSNPGETNSTENASGSGTVVVSYGNDVPVAPLVDSIELLDSAAYDGQLVDLDGNPVTFALNGSGQLVGSTANGTVMVISVTGAVAGPGAGQVTYTYQAQLLQPVQHVDAGNNENTDLLSGIQFQVTDSDGDPATGSFNVTVVDDVPSIENVNAGDDVTVDETAGFPVSNTSDTAAIAFTPVHGADGAAAGSPTYGLSIVGGSPEPSGLSTTSGFAVTLVQIDANTIQGQYNGANVAFTIDIGTDGKVTLTQNVALNHDVDSGPAPTGHNDALDLDGLINATVTITDGDGDEATASAPIGDNLVFLDDGPNAEANLQVGKPELVLDETRPLGQETDGDSSPAGLGTITAGFADNFLAEDHGSDGPGTVSYALDLAVEGTNSGLFALDPTDLVADGDGIGQGAEIKLFTNPDGSVSGKLTVDGPAFFTISVNSAGEITFTQFTNVWHGSTASDDDTSTLTAVANALQLIQTVTDGDGDFDTASIDLSTGVFKIEDDGPEFTADPADAVAENGNSDPVIAALNLDIGTDGYGLLAFNPAHDGDPAEDADGNPLSLGGELLFYQVNGNVLTAETADGDIGFTITLNTNGTYTFDVNGEISNGTGSGIETFSGIKAGNTDAFLVGAGNDDTPFDIIFTAEDGAGNQVTVNNSQGRIATGNQGIDAGETVRIDLVEDLAVAAVSGSNPFGVAYSGHVTGVTHYEQTILQVIGGGNPVVDIQFQVANSDNDTILPIPSEGGADEPLVNITQVTVRDAETGNEYRFTEAGQIFVNDVLLVGPNNTGFTVNFAGTGALVTGIESNDVVELDTATEFNTVFVTSSAANAGNEKFDLGGIFIGQQRTQDPILQDFDIIAQDRDGDQETATISTTINPPADTLAATSFMAQDEQLQKSAANSNTLTLAAAVAAAGMAESAAASPPADDQSLQVESESSVSSQQVNMQMVDGGDEGGSSVSGLADTFKADTASGDSAGRGRGGEHRSDNKLDAASNQQPSDDNSSHQAANDQGPAASQAAATPVAPDVAMVSAEMLIAAGLTGGTAKHNMVEEILVDALGQGGAPTVDGLLAQLPGGLGELAAIANAASPAAGGVPGWDMAMHGGSGFAAEVLTKLDAAMLQHHDAVQPVING